MEINQHHRVCLSFVKVSILFAIALFYTCSFSVRAFYSGEVDNQDKKKKLNKSEVEYYQSDNITNQVPYFDNRFRLDANLEEITLIFYRKRGSKPIILIRPDGSKIRVNEFDNEKVQWFDDRTFDMIKIKKPMPGPWQAIGDILPNSQILVVSDVIIAVEPLPEIVFSGETLKVEGKLFNGDDAIDSPHFKNVVKLDVNFYSTNNSVYENFGADAIKVTSFRDDGRGLDEHANDNAFTGEFVLDFAPGEWQPVYLVKLPMSTRELRQTAIILQKTPVSLDIEISEDTEKSHKLQFTIDPSFVDPDSLVFQGKYTFPDRQVKPFSIMESTGVSRTSKITNTESGLYRVNVSAFGKTISGREFRLAVPEFTFNVEAIESELLEGGDSAGNGTKLSKEAAEALEAIAEQKRVDALIAQQKAQEKEDQETLIIIVAGNLLIILIAVVVFYIMRIRKAKPKKTKTKKTKTKK
ncbi:MAG: TIGR03503 family protein [Colwellia sp.]|nr:TIGR03503 family protein [Colwellia sp.]